MNNSYKCKEKRLNLRCGKKVRRRCHCFRLRNFLGEARLTEVRSGAGRAAVSHSPHGRQHMEGPRDTTPSPSYFVLHSQTKEFVYGINT